MREEMRSLKIEFESTAEIRLAINTCLGGKKLGIRANMLANQL